MEYSWKIVVFEEKKRVMRKFPLLPLPCTKPMDNKKVFGFRENLCDFVVAFMVIHLCTLCHRHHHLGV